MTSDPRHRVDPRTLEILVCPLTKTRLILTPDRTELVSLVARLAFPIRKGVPLLVADAARQISEEEYDALRGHGAGEE